MVVYSIGAGCTEVIYRHHVYTLQQMVNALRQNKPCAMKRDQHSFIANAQDRQLHVWTQWYHICIMSVMSHVCEIMKYTHTNKAIYIDWYSYRGFGVRLSEYVPRHKPR